MVVRDFLEPLMLAALLPDPVNSIPSGMGVQCP